MPKEDLDLDVLLQRHEPLAFLSGTFKRSQKHWSVIEKKTFPIVEAVERLRHLLLLRDEGLRLFTDHRNLIYVFDPILRDNDFKKQAVDKLCRWASKLFALKLVIEHIPGESSIWADILSRWKGDGEQKILRPTLKVLQWNRVIPLANEEFFWPGLDEIRGEQKVSADQEEEEFKEDPDKKSSSEPGRTSMDSKFKAPSREDLHHRPLWSQWAPRKDSNPESN
jgi:hypothetical protein